MKFTETSLKGAFIVEPAPISDDRGFFTRIYCAREFEQHGLKPTVVQANVSFNQGRAPCAACIISCRQRRDQARALHAGAIYDVIIDLRPDSPSYLEHFGVELTADNRKKLYVPEMFAHGYLDARRTAARSFIRSASSTRPAPSAASATTILPSASSWPAADRR